MKSLTLQSPSKLNLYLKVTGKRKDGYHRLYTLFHRISFCDTLRLQKRESGFSLACNTQKVPTDSSNLISKADDLLRKRFPRLKGVHVHLTKRIPIGSGLGGGSGNAATFLLGMKKLYRLKIGQHELLKMGRKLGADVPFFIHNITHGVGTDRGDRIREHVRGPRHHFLLVLSNKGLSTKRVFQEASFRPSRGLLTKVSRAVTILCDFLAEKNYRQVACLIHNDLEIPAFRIRPSLLKIIAAFKKLNVMPTQMSGSGPTVFAILSGPQEAKRIKNKLKRKFPSHKFVLCHSL